MLRDPGRGERTCPDDASPLRLKKIEVPRAFDVSLDECPKCRGLFFDKHEIKRVTGYEKLDELLTRPAALAGASNRKCPACQEPMYPQEAERVEVDVCPACYGVWLEPGELDDIQALPDQAFDPQYFSPERRARMEGDASDGGSSRTINFKAFLHKITRRT